MKHTKRILSLLFALLLLASPLGCVRFADPASDHVDAGSEIEAPVFKLEPSETTPAVETAIPEDETAAPVETPSPVPTSLPTEAPTQTPADTPCPVSEDGEYYTKDEVALYIHLFGHLPKNFVTKSEAKSRGWPGYGSVEPYAPGCMIGGDYYGNYEKLLPVKKGRKYTECDIDTLGRRSRGAKRIVFSNDGLIYYTDDHYESFTLLYGEA